MSSYHSVGGGADALPHSPKQARRKGGGGSGGKGSNLLYDMDCSLPLYTHIAAIAKQLQAAGGVWAMGVSLVPSSSLLPRLKTCIFPLCCNNSLCRFSLL